MIELKPCPFCGGKAELIQLENRYMIYCTNKIKCFVHPKTEFCTVKEMAIKAWNRRAKND